MAFFARPNLDNTQFKQLTGSTLTLSGQTQIATTSGLTLIGDAGTGPAAYGGMYIPIIATGASNNFVLTYDCLQKAIVLKESTVSGGSTVYTYSGLTTCAVGGLPIDQCLLNDPLVDIIHCMVSPSIPPVLTSVSVSSISLCLPNINTLYEVGSQLDICPSISINLGCINPYYQGIPPYVATTRSSNVSGYTFSFQGAQCPFTSSFATTGSETFSNSIIQPDSNLAVGCVSYYSGVTPYYSDGITTYLSGCTAGFKSSCRTITGVYPWYFGSTSSAPILTGTTGTCAQCLISGGTACVGTSTGNIVVQNYCVSGKYIWFAIPSGATNTKTVWDGGNSISNCGTIPGDLFAAECVKYIYSPNDLWGTPTSCYPSTPVPYKIYVSNYPTSIDYTMTYKNN